jgi:hypothetical protein
MSIEMKGNALVRRGRSARDDVGKHDKSGDEAAMKAALKAATKTPAKN